jgi:hypothetical protein
MARGAMDSMPTMGGTSAGPPASATPPSAAARPHVPARHPLLRSLVWTLVGIGIVGLALIAAQRFLVNSPADSHAEQAVTPAAAPPPRQPATSTATKPSPAGEPAAPPLPVASAPAEQPPPPAETADTQPPVRSKPEPPPIRPAHTFLTTVQIVTDPAGARVVVDDNPASSCTSPCLLRLSSGRHTLRADSPGYQTGRRIFSAPEQSDLFLGLDKAIGTLTVSSTPAGAAILLNGKELRQRTPAVLNLAPGTYHVEIVRDGRSVARDVTLANGEMHSLDLTLR